MFWLASALLVVACSFDDHAVHCVEQRECGTGRCYEGFCIPARSNTSSSPQTGSDGGRTARSDGGTNTGGNRGPSNGGRGGAASSDGGTTPPVTEPGGPGECSKEGEERPCLMAPSDTTSAEACNRGMQTCIDGGWSACSGQPMPEPETCNKLDDDCNGEPDDLVEVCYLDGQAGCTQADGRWTCSGACGTGTKMCRDGKLSTCEGATGPVAEECTPTGMVARNEDCDELTDEDCACQPGETRPCYSGRMGTMGVGKCKAGTQTCVNGALGACEGEVHEEAETCANANVDDDCNGTVDDVPTLDDRCVVSEAQGPCSMGALKCSGNAGPACVSSVMPTAEVCNGMDDDCNGRADDTFNLRRDAQNCGTCGNRCAAGQVCCAGRCTNTNNDNNHCGACSRACTDGTRCSNATCMATGMPMAGAPSGGAGSGGRSGSGGAGTGGAGSGGSTAACTPACATGQTCCNGACVNLTSDPNNCNECGFACNPSPSVTDFGCCNGSCVDFTKSPTCGSCTGDCSGPFVGGLVCTCTKVANVNACRSIIEPVNICEL